MDRLVDRWRPLGGGDVTGIDRGGAETVAPESDSVPGGMAAVNKSLAELGPMTGAQKRLGVVSVLLLLAWATEGRLHPFDTTSTTYAGLVILLLPRFGVMTWKDVQSRIPGAR